MSARNLLRNVTDAFRNLQFSKILQSLAAISIPLLGTHACTSHEPPQYICLCHSSVAHILSTIPANNVHASFSWLVNGSLMQCMPMILKKSIASFRLIFPRRMFQYMLKKSFRSKSFLYQEILHCAAMNVGGFLKSF